MALIEHLQRSDLSLVRGRGALSRLELLIQGFDQVLIRNRKGPEQALGVPTGSPIPSKTNGVFTRFPSRLNFRSREGRPRQQEHRRNVTGTRTTARLHNQHTRTPKFSPIRERVSERLKSRRVGGQ